MVLSWLDKNGKLILVEKAVRTIPYGFLGVIYAVYLSELGFDPFLIGVVLTATIASSAFYTLIASFVADSLGRRKTLVFFAMTDAVAGLLLFSSAAWWAPVTAGIVGNMTVGAGEVGPYLSLEQSILPQAADDQHRTWGFSIYNVIGYASTGTGALLVGLPQLVGYSSTDYRPLFLIYLSSGLLASIIYSRLSQSVEKVGGTGQRWRDQPLSPGSKPIVAKLSALFAVDAFGGGFIGQSILSYYFYLQYHLHLDSLGQIFAAASVVTAISFLIAPLIAKRLGLLRTMVFSHIPSNLLLLLVPFAPTVGSAVTLLLCRQSLSQMDVPTRQSFVMSMVPAEDRTKAAGLTNVSRTAASSISPSLAGYTIETFWIGSPLLLAACLKLVYDLAIYRSFRTSEPSMESGPRVSPKIETGSST